MYQSPASAKNVGLTLASAPSFHLGDLEIHPASREAMRDGAREMLEPKVMQVLVVLAEAKGDVVSRDDLIARCWNGRIVGENAINRVISRVRALGSGFGRDAFAVETIAKVGYRLVSAEPTRSDGQQAAAPDVTAEPATSLVGRRAVIAAGLVAVAGITIFVRRSPAVGPLPEAQTLYRKGVEAQRQGLAEQNVQAAAYFREAVGKDPGYAAAWGALALSYRHLLETGRPQDDLATTASWSRSAAARALKLDPDNADARVALILIKPYFRNWTALEQELRAALRQYPEHWLLWGNLGRIMGETGRWQAAIEPFHRASAIDPFLPITQARLGIALWSSGQLQDAEATFDAAAARWPAHPAIWFPRFDFLALGGRPAAAIAMASQTDLRPVGIPDEMFAAGAGLAEAVQIGEATPAPPPDTLVRSADALPTGRAVQYLATLGAIDDAYRRIDRYFFARKLGSPPSTGSSLERRYTDFLFMPATEPLRRDRRFPALVSALGLETYWRMASVQPDFRR